MRKFFLWSVIALTTATPAFAEEHNPESWEAFRESSASKSCSNSGESWTEKIAGERCLMDLNCSTGGGTVKRTKANWYLQDLKNLINTNGNLTGAKPAPAPPPPTFYDE